MAHSKSFFTKEHISQRVAPAKAVDVVNSVLLHTMSFTNYTKKDRSIEKECVKGVRRKE